MYLPTFWKMMAESSSHKFSKFAGYGLPIGAMGKFPTIKIARAPAVLASPYHSLEQRCWSS